VRSLLGIESAADREQRFRSEMARLCREHLDNKSSSGTREKGEKILPVLDRLVSEQRRFEEGLGDVEVPDSLAGDMSQYRDSVSLLTDLIEKPLRAANEQLTVAQVRRWRVRGFAQAAKAAQTAAEKMGVRTCAAETVTTISVPVEPVNP
jgi:hypothetical protein